MLNNHRSRKNAMVLFVSVLLLLPFSYNCIEKPLEPVLPKWDTQLTIPIMERTYFFGEVVEKDIRKFDTSGTTILYKPIVKGDAFKENLPASVFDMPAPRGNTTIQEIGVVPFTVPTIPSSIITPTQLGLSAGPVDGATPDPPPIPFRTVFGDSTTYKYIVFENGQMTLSITNNFPFAIQIDGGLVQMVNNNDTTEVVANFEFASPIQPGITVSSNVEDLADRKMDAGLVMKGAVQIINWAGTTISPQDNIVAQAVISNSNIKSALAKTETFDGTNVIAVPDSAVLLDDSIKVKFAKFVNGQMQVRIINRVSLQLTVEFKIDELFENATGKPYALPGTNSLGYTIVEPGDSLVTVIDMKDMTFVSRLRNAFNDTLVTQDLHFHLAIKTLAASNDFVVVNKTDYVITDVQPVQSFTLEELQGKVPPTYLAISKEIDAGIGDIGKNLTLTEFNSDISINANVFSSGLFPSDMFIDIYAIDDEGNRSAPVRLRNQDDITNNRNYHRIIPGESGDILLISNDINSLMNSFLATKKQLPSKFLIDGYTIIDPQDVYLSNDPTFRVGIGGVKQNDSVTVSLDYSIPVVLAIKDGSLKDTSSFAQNNIDTTLVNSIKSGKILFDIENTFPIDINVTMNLLRASAMDSSIVDITSPPVLTLPQDTINYPIVRVPADTTSNRTGVKTFTRIDLSSEDALKLPQASFAALNLEFFTGQNLGLKREFYKSDRIHMKVYADIEFTVDIDRITK